MEWTKQEITYLQGNYYSSTYQEIAKHLKRPIGGVSWQVQSLGLKKTGIYRPSTLNLSALTHADIAYMAGFIDGEGTITINCSRGKKGPEVYVVNTDFEIITWFEEVFGTNKYHKSKPIRGRKQTFAVGLSSLKDTYMFLQLIYPHLRVKREQARILLEYCKIRLKKTKKNKNTNFDSVEEELEREIHRVNRRGTI